MSFGAVTHEVSLSLKAGLFFSLGLSLFALALFDTLALPPHLVGFLARLEGLALASCRRLPAMPRRAARRYIREMSLRPGRFHRALGLHWIEHKGVLLRRSLVEHRLALGA